MKYEFRRIDEIDLHSFARQMQQQYAALDTLLEGEADTMEILSYVEEMLADGRPCKGMPEALFWGFDEPENMPGDARVDYFYMPTYLNTAFLMQAFRMIPEQICERIPAFKEKLGRAMTGCSGRRFAGHGYEKDDFVQGMQIFASVRTKEFIRNHKDIVPEVFRDAYRAALRSIERDVFDKEGYLRRVETSWENNHLEEYREILAAENAGRHTLFVYGSLMKGGYNHPGFMADAEYLGTAVITGFNLYDLGHYPGIKHTKEQHVVRGELYDVSDAEFEAICALEGNGSLYQCETAAATLGGQRDWMPAEVFVYLGRTDDKRKISGKEQLWTEGNKRGEKGMDYIWYACYGSNINKSRFMNYIDRCRDTTPPVEDRPFEFDHPVFFAGKSFRWGGKGKAFLDIEKNGHAFGRIYKITQNQYDEVKRKEGPDYQRKVDLGELDGIPVVSFTNGNNPVPRRAVPSLEYLNIILDGLKETYPDDTLIPEMDKDVKRLQLIADRFSKIGSVPAPVATDLLELLGHVVDYMDRRTSKKVKILTDFPAHQVIVDLNGSLFEWVIENLCKNAVDAMGGEQGTITLKVVETDAWVYLDVRDTGKGIRKRNINNVFRPGFTTKKRGWGLGLSLAKRIVEEYHHGRIYVKESVVGKGTTFRIELRKCHA